MLQGLALAAQLLSALAFAHRRHLVHSAINPHNLLVSRTGQLKVAGFGWAERRRGSLRMMPLASRPNAPQAVHNPIRLTEKSNIPRLGPHTKASDQVSPYVPI